MVLRSTGHRSEDAGPADTLSCTPRCPYDRHTDTALEMPAQWADSCRRVGLCSDELPCVHRGMLACCRPNYPAAATATEAYQREQTWHDDACSAQTQSAPFQASSAACHRIIPEGEGNSKSREAAAQGGRLLEVRWSPLERRRTTCGRLWLSYLRHCKVARVQRSTNRGCAIAGRQARRALIESGAIWLDSTSPLFVCIDVFAIGFFPTATLTSPRRPRPQRCFDRY